MNILRAMWGFNGRISRKYFWLATLVWFIGFFAVSLALVHLSTGGEWLDNFSDKQLDKAVDNAVLVSSLILLYPWLAISIKRLHDLRLSGWWCVPAFVADAIYQLSLVLPDPSPTLAGMTCTVSIFFIVVLGFIRGTDGPNEYGDDQRVKPVGMVPMPA